MSQQPPERRLPEFDWDHQGNPFQWIVATAPRVRAQWQSVQDLERAIRRARIQSTRDRDDEAHGPK